MRILIVEAGAVVGDFVAEGARRDVPAPMLSAAWTALSIYEATRAG